MPSAKMETKAEEYRRIKAAKAKNETLHDVTCPAPDCGMVWKGRKVGVDFWVSSGILPVHLVETMVKAIGKKGQPEDAVKTLATKEVLQSIVFASKVVRYTAVEPHIADTIEGPNDILPEDVDVCCYTALLNWQMRGGEEAERLENFRTK